MGNETDEDNVTIEEHEISTNEFNGVITEQTRDTEENGWITLRIKESEQITYASIDNKEENRQKHLNQIAQMNRDNAESVLTALAEYLGYDVVKNNNE